MTMLRTILGWIMPLLILGCGVAAFMAMGSQPPPTRIAAEGVTATAVQTVTAVLPTVQMTILRVPVMTKTTLCVQMLTM